MHSLPLPTPLFLLQHSPLSTQPLCLFFPLLPLLTHTPTPKPIEQCRCALAAACASRSPPLLCTPPSLPPSCEPRRRRRFVLALLCVHPPQHTLILLSPIRSYPILHTVAPAYAPPHPLFFAAVADPSTLTTLAARPRPTEENGPPHSPPLSLRSLPPQTTPPLCLSILLWARSFCLAPTREQGPPMRAPGCACAVAFVLAAASAGRAALVC